MFQWAHPTLTSPMVAPPEKNGCTDPRFQPNLQHNCKHRDPCNQSRNSCNFISAGCHLCGCQHNPNTETFLGQERVQTVCQGDIPYFRQALTPFSQREVQLGQMHLFTHGAEPIHPDMSAWNCSAHSSKGDWFMAQAESQPLHDNLRALKARMKTVSPKDSCATSNSDCTLT